MSNFKKSEIVGYTYIDGRRVTVLKPGVRRKHYNDHIDPSMLEGHINMQLIIYDKIKEFKQLIGEAEFEQD